MYPLNLHQFENCLSFCLFSQRFISAAGYYAMGQSNAFVDKFLIRLLQLCTVLTRSHFAMGDVIESNRLFFTVSMIMWPILIYNLHTFAILLYILFLHQVLRVRLSCADQI